MEEVMVIMVSFRRGKRTLDIGGGGGGGFPSQPPPERNLVMIVYLSCHRHNPSM